MLPSRPTTREARAIHCEVERAGVSSSWMMRQNEETINYSTAAKVTASIHARLSDSYIQGDHGGLTLGFIDFGMVCSSAWPNLQGQVKFGQRWHGNLVNWRNTRIDIYKI